MSSRTVKERLQNRAKLVKESFLSKELVYLRLKSIHTNKPPDLFRSVRAGGEVRSPTHSSSFTYSCPMFRARQQDNILTM
jgi:hypothetical protein